MGGDGRVVQRWLWRGDTHGSTRRAPDVAAALANAGWPAVDNTVPLPEPEPSMPSGRRPEPTYGFPGGEYLPADGGFVDDGLQCVARCALPLRPPAAPARPPGCSRWLGSLARHSPRGTPAQSGVAATAAGSRQAAAARSLSDRRGR
jgi:hypothetical protein